MWIERSERGDLGPKGGEAAYIYLNDNDIDHTVEIDESSFVDVDEDGCIVGLELLDPKSLPSIEDIEHEVSLDRSDITDLEAAFEKFGAYDRIKNAFGA